ncbi:hypothetical protein CC78DRAFT_575962 [Lojkania enalia]|uniref:MOSC domain-containing protein n=1 Tax=Lojkania enalia TaxID=147567 RepID=A0A9P4N3I2_9PLEO|nr:hypothetical protein CC78DRAFT_575962 [Didymosphaeria enalia]
MKISEIYVYPIKSLRPAQLSEAVATKHGFANDRRFMLLKAMPEGYKNMAVCHFPEMTLFLTKIVFPEQDEGEKGSVVVEFRAPGHTESKMLKIPLQPDTTNLELFEVSIHRSTTQAFKMPAEYSLWFSECFGYDVILAYLGDNLRSVLFEDMKPAKGNSWLSTISNTILGSAGPEEARITFADCAPYLLASKTSLVDVSSRLPEGEEMDVTKFRPNIVIEGAEEAWEEDYWGKIEIDGAELTLAHNCIRCKSINIDYTTGLPGTGESGSVLKKLQKDRRVDKGAKWSAVFGRYSFWNSKNRDTTFRVGDEVTVTQRNPERTTWSWKGLG